MKNLALIFVVIFFSLFGILQYIVREKFFKKNIEQMNIWQEKKFLLAIFLPKDYIEKKNFWRGYLLYLLSILFLILAFVIIHFWLTI